MSMAVDTKTKTVLIVDDEPDIRDLYRFAFEDEGFTVEVAVDGLDGIEQARLVQPDLVVLDLAMPRLELPGVAFQSERSQLVLVTIAFCLFAVLVLAIRRGPYGRRLAALRDSPVAASTLGMNLVATKATVFAVSAGMAGVAGALFGAYQQFVEPDGWGLFLSIQYIAIIIVGGVGTVFGAVLGALFLGGLPAVIENYSDSIPGVATSASGDGFISVFSLNQAIFGLLIVLFLMFEPRGLAAMWLRVKAYFKAWPFSY